MEQREILLYAVTALEELNVPYAVVGSYASMSYGEYRLTQDIDILIDLKMTQVDPLCERFPPPEWYVSSTAARDAVWHRHQFNVIHPATSNKIDFMLPRADRWGRHQLDRRRKLELLPTHEINVAHPEDVILSKLRYYKSGGADKHLRDIAGMLDVSAELIDRDNVARWAEQMGVLDVWRTIVQRVDHGDRSIT